MVVEANLDDLPGELFPPLLEAVFAAGAVDAWLTPIIGKKGRPAQCLTALCDPDLLDAVSGAIFSHSSTLGVRYHETPRMTMARTFKKVATPWGDVSVKVGARLNGQENLAPEFEDCRALAEAAAVPVKQVYEAALAAAVKGEWSNG